jgi:hypothetical protein
MNYCIVIKTIDLILVFNPSAPSASSSSDDPLFEEPIAPTLSLGERIAWVQTSGPEFGIVKWIGRMPQITNDWTVGVEFVSALTLKQCSLKSNIQLIN